MSTKSNIEILLGEWGAWKRDENKTGLGYPSAAAFTQMRVDNDRRLDPYALLVDDDLRRLDTIIMNAHCDDRCILVFHYIRSGDAKSKRKELGLVAQRYYERLKTATWYVGCSMGGKYSPPATLLDDF